MAQPCRSGFALITHHTIGNYIAHWNFSPDDADTILAKIQ
jgi:hypothetical protein